MSARRTAAYHTYRPVATASATKLAENKYSYIFSMGAPPSASVQELGDSGSQAFRRQRANIAVAHESVAIDEIRGGQPRHVVAGGDGASLVEQQRQLQTERLGVAHHRLAVLLQVDADDHQTLVAVLGRDAIEVWHF